MNNTVKWDKSQEEFLIKNYGKLNAKEIGIIIGKTPSSVTQRAFKLKINKINYNEWRDDDIQMLYDCYPSFNKTELMKIFPNRKWGHIVSKAKKLSIKRNNKHLEKIIGKTEKLLFDNVISYYWIGFLLADGHFSKNNRLSITLSIKDREHLLKLATYLESNLKINKKQTTATISILDTYNVKKIKEKFDISNNKTENLPKIESFLRISDEHLFSLIVGYIDGDGSIEKQYQRNDVILRIQIHKNWLPFLYIIHHFLQKYIGLNLKSNPYINNSGYAQTSIANSEFLTEIKKKIIEFNLPFMERKWNNIQT